MTPFCHNKLCRYRDPVAHNVTEYEILENDCFIKLRRVPYVRADGQNYFFCSICHNAIQMVSTTQETA